MRHFLLKTLMLILLLGTTAFHVNAQGTLVALVVTTTDNEELTYLLTEESRLYFENGETLVINDGADATMTFELAKIRKIVCTEVTGTTENEAPMATVFPNPTHNRFMVKNLAEPCHARIFSLDGRLVKAFDAQDGDVIDISELAEGMYLLSINGLTLKLMKL